MSEAISGVSILGAAVKHAVKADVQFYESYGTSAFNRKLQGIVTPGIYAGFMPVLAGGLNATITSLQAENGRGVASIDVGEHQLSVKQLEDVTLTIPTNATTRVMLEANYEFGVKTSQVDSTSSIPSARIFLADISEPEEANQLELCRFIVPAGATQLTASMLVVSYRKNRALGIALSDAIDSDRDDLAATPRAVKKAVETLTGVNPSALLDTIAKLAMAVNNDPKFFKTIADLLALKAPLASPLFTGSPKAPTPDPADNSTLIATTNFVHEAIAKLVGSSPEALDTLAELAAALGNDANFSKTVLDALANKQPKDSTLSALAGKNIAGLLDYLGLKEAANRGVGTGSGQIPDMSNFRSGGGWVEFPDGTIIQMGTNIAGSVGSPALVNFPVPFTQYYKIATSFDVAAPNAGDCPAFATTPAGTARAAFYLMSSRGPGTSGAGANWIAIGK